MQKDASFDDWISFDPRLSNNVNLTDYVENLSDEWSLYLSKIAGENIPLDLYKRIVEDIVLASEYSNNPYPISTTDQYLVIIMPTDMRDWLKEYLNNRIAVNSGDVRIALESFLTDCLSV